MSGALITIEGRPAAREIVSFNGGLNYGRFFGRTEIAYEFRLGEADLVPRFAVAFDAVVAEMEEDDKLDGELSPLGKMGYPTLTRAFDSPEHLAEAIDMFFDRGIFGLFLNPTNEHALYVLNSTDQVLLEKRTVVIRGRCWMP